MLFRSIEFVNEYGMLFSFVIALALYIVYSQKQIRQDNKEREAQSREDSLRREESLLNHLSEMSEATQVLLDTNAVLARDINIKLDMILKGGTAE